MSHIHGPIVRTPDSKPGATKEQLYADNIEYMDKLVGKLIAELDRLHLREKTAGPLHRRQRHGPFGVEAATVNGRAISGMKGTMLEGGSRVPLIVNWPGVAPAGKVNHDLIDFSDFFATFAELAGAKLPEGVTLDSHSFAPQIRGEKGTPRDWVYVELNGKSYVRDARFKLTNGGESVRPVRSRRTKSRPSPRTPRKPPPRGRNSRTCSTATRPPRGPSRRSLNQRECRAYHRWPRRAVKALANRGSNS